jgi:putative redox protein
MSEHRSKETIAHVPVETQSVGGMLFDAGRANGPKVRIDGDATSAPSPFDLLLAAIASCASTDLLTIFRKQRTPTRSLKVTVEATRVSATPQRLASAVLHFEIRGAGITLEKAKSAVELSVTKYCSVRSSLIADAPVTWTIDLKT